MKKLSFPLKNHVDIHNSAFPDLFAHFLLPFINRQRKRSVWMIPFDCLWLSRTGVSAEMLVPEQLRFDKTGEFTCM